MNLLANLGHLGAAVEAGSITHDDAVQQLMERSEGGLTALGAAEALTHWRTGGSNPAVTEGRQRGVMPPDAFPRASD